MKYALLIALLLFTASPALALDFSKLSRRPSTAHNQRGLSSEGSPGFKIHKSKQPDPPRLARITTYWTGEKGGRISALGTRLRPGHCAVDPRRIPYGSKVRVGGETLTAVDTGSAVRSRRAARRSGRTVEQRAAIVIDKFFSSRRLAMAWMSRHPLFMPVTVL